METESKNVLTKIDNRVKKETNPQFIRDNFVADLKTTRLLISRCNIPVSKSLVLLVIQSPLMTSRRIISGL